MCHVLIIEDEALIALDLQDLLEAEGATSVAIADTQDEAVRSARERRPDVITSDVTLRHGTGPAAVATIIGEMGPMPVIFITATPDAYVDCGPPAVVLRKPLQHHTIVRTFRTLRATD